MTAKTNGATNSSKTQLTPVSSNVSSWGTTVSYGIAGTSNTNGQSTWSNQGNAWSNQGNAWSNQGNAWSNQGNAWGNKGNAWDNQGNAWNNSRSTWGSPVTWVNAGNTWGHSGNNWSGSGSTWSSPGGNWNSGNTWNSNPGSNWGNATINAINHNGWGASGVNSYNNINPVSNYWDSNQIDNSLQYAQSTPICHFPQSKLVQPSVDISETSSDIVISAYVSNEVLNDLSLNVSEDSVTISGSLWTGNDSLLLSRTIPLTTSVRAEACAATLQSGILDIRLPKTEKSSRNKVTISKDIVE